MNLLRGKKIRLRALEPEDVEFLYSIENDTAMWDVGCTSTPYSRFALNSYVMGNTADIFADKQMRLMIESLEGVAVGLIDLFHFDPKNQRAEIGIAVAAKYRNQGYAGEAISLIQKYCKKVAHLHQLYAWVDAENLQSISMFRKAGFDECATLKEWLYDGQNYRDAVLLNFFLKKADFIL